MQAPLARTFVGRSAESAAMNDVLSKLRGGASAALLVTGDPGIGKTRLLQELVTAANDVEVISISGYESENDLGFAALHRMVAPFLDRLGALPAPQHAALAVVFGQASAGAPPDQFLIGLATLALFESLARERPLLCVIDDVQWVDEDSVNTLAFVARRLDAQGGVALVFGLRINGAVPEVFSGIPECTLAPMSDIDMRRLLAGAVSSEPARYVSTRIIAESEGNPLALLEYTASLSDGQLTGRIALPPALPVGERIYTTFATRLQRLPEDTRTLLLLAAVAGAADQEIVSEAQGRLNITDEAAWPARRESLITAHSGVGFRHPLIRSVVYEVAGDAARRDMHALLAAVAEELGFVDTAAWHRAHFTVGPDEQVAEQLERTAQRARTRGGYAAEARFMTMSAQYSAPATAQRQRRLLAAARSHVIAGNNVQAEQLLDGMSADARAEAERARAIFLDPSSRKAGSAAVLVEAAAATPPTDIEQKREMLCSAMRAALASRHITVGITLAEVAQTLLDHPHPSGEPTAPELIYEGLAVRCTRGYLEAAPIMAEALRQLAADPETATAKSVLLSAALASQDLWDDDFESSVWPAMVSLNQDAGALPHVWGGLACQARTEARHGHFDRAERLFEQANQVSLAIRTDRDESWAPMVEAEFRAWQGREGQTRAMVQTLQRWSEEVHYGAGVNFGRLALTVLELSLGRPDRALVHAKEVADDDPPGYGSRILPELVEAAVRAGDHTSATRALETLTARAAVAGTPWAMGLATRSQAVALQSSREASRFYEEALGTFAATPMRPETARTHLLYGEWLRRRKRRGAAADHLSAAVAEFRAMGAAGFAQRAERELRATGMTTVAASTSSNGLTPQEQRVAELAARGQTNVEISRALFISDSTVEYHLAKIFRKLRINSRRRLRDALDTEHV